MKKIPWWKFRKATRREQLKYHSWLATIYVALAVLTLITMSPFPLWQVFLGVGYLVIGVAWWFIGIRASRIS